MNKRISKIWSLLLSVSLVVTSISVSSYAEEVNYESYYSDEMNVYQNIDLDKDDISQDNEVCEEELPGEEENFASSETVEEGACGTSLNYRICLEDDVYVLYISGTGAMTSTPWKSFEGAIKTVRISDGLTDISLGAFSDMTSIENVIFKDVATLSIIRKNAFNNCSGLKEIVFPMSLLTIGESAFADCTSLSKIVFNDRLTTIEAGAFKNDINAFTTENGVEIIIPDSVTGIGRGAFEGIPATYVSVPKVGCGSQRTSTDLDDGFGIIFGYQGTESDEYAGDYTAKTSAYSTLYYYKTPKTLKKIQITKDTYYYEAFIGNKYVEEIILAPNATRLSGTFQNCTALTKIIIPDTVSDFMDAPFKGCSSLEKINIPAKLQTLVSYSFEDCTSLSEVIFPSNGVLKTIDYRAFDGTALEYVEIPSTVTTVNGGAFMDCTSLKEISFPSKITSFGLNVLKGCTALKKVTNASSTSCPLPSSEFVNQARPTSGNISAIASGTAVNINEKVFFDAQGGTVSKSSAAAKYYTYYPDLPSASMVGYLFDGWYTAPEGGTAVSKSVRITTLGDHTVYAHYTAYKYTVTFDANGGVLEGETTKLVSCDSAYGELPIPTKDNFIFTGWYTEAEGGELVTEETVLTSETGSHTLYAHWHTTELSLTLDKNEDVSSNNSIITVNYNAPYGELPVPERTNYEFLGWFTTREGGVEITAETVVTETNDHSLFAHWQGIEVTVRLECNSADISANEITVRYMEKLGEIPTPSYPGMVFTGWFIDPDTEVDEDFILDRTDDVVLVAHWDRAQYTLTFDAAGGEVDAASKTITCYEAYGELPIPTKPDYTFVGWFTALEGGTEITEETVAGPELGSHTVYAHWRGQAVTVTFDVSGGVLDNDTMTVYFDGNYGELPVPERTGYDFAGWYLDDVKIEPATVVSVSENHTLVAHWSVKILEVKYVYYGDISGTEMVEYGKCFAEPARITRENHKFLRWQLGDRTYDFSTPVTENIVINAI